MEKNGGEVCCARVVIDPKTGESKGHGLVEFKDEEGFQKALELHGTEYEQSSNIISVKKSLYSASIAAKEEKPNPYLSQPEPTEKGDKSSLPSKKSVAAIPRKKGNFLMVPTALRRKTKTIIYPPPPSKVKGSNSTVGATKDNGPSLQAGKKGNEAFRAMFLK
mmetsp:Transcript_30537/g.52748  ORF Transcript_30537/g.52748 Transcript_30537/m.52748 type:complete len:163 (+) Transcript_30537:400-888(+)